MARLQSVSELIARIEALPGWRVSYDRRHYRCYAPNGTSIVTVSRTPSDRRALRNARADLRRAGADL